MRNFLLSVASMVKYFLPCFDKIMHFLLLKVIQYNYAFKVTHFYGKSIIQDSFNVTLSLYVKHKLKMCHFIPFFHRCCSFYISVLLYCITSTFIFSVLTSIYPFFKSFKMCKNDYIIKLL